VSVSIDVATTGLAAAEAGMLSGFTVVELAGLPGQLCGRILADLGTDVIKVEPPGGDPVRRMSPFHREESVRFAYLNSGKKSVVFDLDRQAGRDQLHDLIGGADILLVAPGSDSVEHLGVPLELLADRHDRLVIVSITGFGRSGPFADYLYTDIVALAMGGLMAVSGSPELPPVHAPETQAYYFASVFGAQGAALALLRRETGYGKGAIVDVSIQQTLASIEQLVRIFGLEGRVVRRTGSQHKHVAPARIYPTKDGFISLFVTDHHWKAFLDAWLDHPPELDDPALVRTRQRMARLDMINAEVRNLTARYTNVEFVALMNDAGVPCTPVNSLVDFLTDDQTRQRGVEMPVTHPGLPPAVQVAFPAIIDGHRPPTRRAPRLGEHTSEVLSGYLRLSAADQDALDRKGASRS